MVLMDLTDLMVHTGLTVPMAPTRGSHGNRETRVNHEIREIHENHESSVVQESRKIRLPPHS